MTDEPAAECYCEDRHLVFATEAEAIEAEAAITLAMGFYGVTTRWDVPRQCEDGRWIFAIPPEMPEMPEPAPKPDGETP
jgi:hypothetical protein